MSSSEWLPPPVPFEIVRRGYSPDQVTAHIEKLEYDLRIATANRDATSERLAELSGQLSAAQAEADALRAQLDRQALEPMSMSGLSDRMQRMIRIAEEEAAETRSSADSYSTELRERAEKEVAELRAKAEAEVADLRARANAEVGQHRRDMQAKRAELDEARAAFDAERDRTRVHLSEQVTTLLAEATAQAETTRRLAREEAERLTAEAEAHADQLVSTARQEADRLAAEAAAQRAEQEEDFTLAIGARRTEAHRAITESEQTSKADAAARIAQATQHARQLIASATEHANDLARRAAAESHQRVLDADQAVQALTSLRSELHQQLGRLGEHLSQVRIMVESADPMLAPPDAERDRPRAEDFPADPAERPTVADGYDANPPAWEPPEPPQDPADRRAAEEQESAEPAVDDTGAVGDAVAAEHHATEQHVGGTGETGTPDAPYADQTVTENEDHPNETVTRPDRGPGDDRQAESESPDEITVRASAR